MEELDNSARVWRVSNDESERIDVELVDGWTDTLDTLFIFAGLFSAVVATFLTQTTQFLQQNYSAVTASLLTEMVMLQRATAIGRNMSVIPQSGLTYDSAFTPSSGDVWLNSLWLASLGLTLSVALMAGLIKQWLHYYLADITGTTPKVRACTRQFRHRGLIQWGVPLIIESLPVLMNTSLLLFFIGLILFTRDLSGTDGISWFLVGLTTISFIIYIGSSFIPVWKPQCPYKTSLSKVYNGIIKAVWYFIERLPLEDEQTARPSFKHYSMQFKRWITKLLSHGSSLRKAESETVINQGFMLQQNVITEMALNSTNPSVSAIALQSLAALHAFQIYQVSHRLSDTLFKKLRDLYCGCFQHDSSKQWGYSITSDSSVAERYSRAMLLFSDRIPHGDGYWARLLSLSPPENLHTAVLLTSAWRRIMKSQLFASPRMKEDLKSLIQFTLEIPSIEVSKLIPWHHHQLIKTIEDVALLDLYSADEEGQLLVALVKRLSPSNALTLQEDLLIRYLYAYRAKAGAIEPLKGQSLTKELNSETSVDITRRSRATLLQLITLLPDIADCAVSLGSEDQDRLHLYLSEMDFRGSMDKVYMDWDNETAFLHTNKSEFSSCVYSLIKLLDRLTSSWEEWNGDVRTRLMVIRNLRDSLRFHWKCNEQVTHAIFHWLLVLSFQDQDCPGNAEIISLDDQASVESLLLESLFPSPDQEFLLINVPKDHLIDSLGACCAFVTSKQLAGLPSVVMKWLSEKFKYLLEESYESVVLCWLDTLFRYFIEQDPLKMDPVYPMTRAEQDQTLNSLIDFAHGQQFRSSHWGELLFNWRVLVFDKTLKVPAGEVANVGNNTNGTSLTSWSSEDNNSIENDPWDLRDILWMFEAQIPFKRPLNLERLLRHLDWVLGLREGSMNLRGVTWFFKNASDDPYPLPDNPNLET